MSKLDLELIPGQRLGPFALGTSLWSVLESLRQQQTAYPHISVSFDSSEPANSPILIHLRPYFDLLFTSSQQRLHTISVRLVDAEPPLSLQYKATQLLSSELPLRRVDVSRVFGPTYAGPTMKYPGIWFGFEEDPKSLPKRQGVEDKTQEVKRIVLSQHTDDQPAAVDPMDRITPCEAMEGDIIRVTAKLHSGISMRFHSNNSHRPDIQVLLQKTTAQDLLASIGPPLRVHYKDDDRLAIHGSAKSGSQQSYFYNYFQYGLDFLLSGDTHCVQKIIIHSNIPGTPLFQQYNRCPWVLDLREGSEARKGHISFKSRFEDVVNIFPGLHTAAQMNLNRMEETELTLPYAQTDLIGMDGVVFEVTKIGYLTSFTMF